MKDNLKEIAKKHFNLKYVEKQGSDRLDFHTVSIVSIREALEAAYAAGESKNYDLGFEEGHCTGYQDGKSDAEW